MKGEPKRKSASDHRQLRNDLRVAIKGRDHAEFCAVTDRIVADIKTIIAIPADFEADLKGWLGALIYCYFGGYRRCASRPKQEKGIVKEKQKSSLRVNLMQFWLASRALVLRMP